MSPFVQVLLSLFGAALLGNIIGWFARRIVAVRDERALIEQHQRQMSDVQKDLVHEREDNKSLSDRVASLEAQVADMDRLNQTIEASEKELRELRVESQVLKDESQVLKEESLVLKNETQTLRDKSHTLQQQLREKNERLNNLGVEASQAKVDQRRVAIAPDNELAYPANPAANGAVDLQRYALGSVAAGTAELEVDDDIADLTSDLSSVLTPEMQRELASADARPGPSSGNGRIDTTG